ncbi:uncharacterized protein DUF1707 [Haloactinopolyspora alba]|uniref:Uncharacterized protein DUF1707 n=1 Tax=Haloactinopolyspora alba TaxID=648780 RepID=A0A2P8E7F6_9ACTN|nr:DUF1707 domain-containing protein [Haloactinopolyspora alba]PSL05404.1 uncharacterized protein DUF1707 [Haloactinopolyspora alba]
MTQTRSLRIGDAERDAAVSALGEHYAAGRLTKDEYDERASAVTAARFDADLDPLFTDLPADERAVDTRSATPARRVGRGIPDRAPRARAMLLIPLAVMFAGGMLFMIASSAPWMLFILFWLWVCGGGFGFHRARHHHRTASAHFHG